MELNKIIKVECVDINHQGLGVVKVDGFPIFVNNLLVGEQAMIEVIKLEKKYGYGKVKEILKYSESRVEPKCSAYGACGGCEIMHMDYQTQLDFKVKMAKEAFKRIGHLDNVEVDRIIGMDDPYYYRNKVQIPFRKKKGEVICGFYKKGTHDIIPLEECLIEPIIATELAKYVRDLANEYKISAYNEEHQKGVLRHVLIRKTSNDEYMLVLITNEDTIPNQEEVITKIVERFPDVKTIIQNINKKDTNIILGHTSKVLYGPGSLFEELMGLKFILSHQTFFQTNHIQTEKLYKQVLDYVKPHKNDVIVDGYCGVGTISLLLAKHCKKVYGIEIINESIKDARTNAMLNDIENVQFIVGKTEEELAKLDMKIHTIVVDPPRKGCDKQLLDIIIEKAIKRIVYVSCDVATLARDLEILSNNYNILGVTLVDMFPHTSNVETCVLLELK